MKAETAAPPDIALLGPEWPTRALLRAQLLEAGYEVTATDAWPFPKQYLRPGMKPRVAIVDLQGLPEPQRVLDELRVVMRPGSVLVVTALGTLAPDDLHRQGFHVVSRPATIGQIVAAAAALLSMNRGGQQNSDR